MKIVLPNGTRLEGTLAELKPYIEGKKKPGSKSRLAEWFEKRGIGISLQEARKLSKDTKCPNIAKAMGCQLVKAYIGGSRIATIILPPSNNKEQASSKAVQRCSYEGIAAILERDGQVKPGRIRKLSGDKPSKIVKELGKQGLDCYFKAYKGIMLNDSIKKEPGMTASAHHTRNNTIKLAAAIERDGFMITRNITNLLGYKTGLSNIYRTLKKAFPSKDFVKVHRKGIALAGQESELSRYNRFGRKASMRKLDAHNRFMSERIVYYMRKEGMSRTDAFARATYDWNQLKKQGAPVPEPKTMPKNIVYAAVINELAARGVSQYSPYKLSIIGQTLRERGSISWDFKNMYLSEAEWNDKVIPVLLTHASDLQHVWNVERLYVDNGVLKAR